MMTQGKTGYWFRSLKVRPGKRREVDNLECDNVKSVFLSAGPQGPPALLVLDIALLQHSRFK